MTEAEWQNCTNAEKMLKCLHGKVSDRKLRLFACACCASIAHLGVDPRSAWVVEVAERVADGLATEADWNEALNIASGAGNDDQPADMALEDLVTNCVGGASVMASAVARHSMEAAVWEAVSSVNAPKRPKRDRGKAETSLLQKQKDQAHKATTVESKRHVEWMVDIFGNPFRPISINPHWQTSTVLSLAQTIYDERAFERMPILADALEEAGCSNAEILDHCRGPGPHVRGCWVVDLLLGKG